MKLDMNIDEYLPLREVVFHTLRKAIIQGELQPGERLMEVTLANKLGVSRTYPALQGTDAPRVHICKNTAVYPADWLAENYRHYLKVRFVLQQLQMVQRAELVYFAPPRPHIIIQIIAPLVRVVETDFYLYGVFVFFCVLDNARYH